MNQTQFEAQDLPRRFNDYVFHPEDFIPTGQFRAPVIGEFYISRYGLVFKATAENETSGSYRTILAPKVRQRRLVVESPDTVGAR